MKIRDEKNEGLVVIDFPEQLISTNVGRLNHSLFTQLEALELTPEYTKVRWVMSETRMIDSLGLNLLVSLLEWAEKNHLAVESHILDDMVFKTLDAVWLTRKMSVQRITD